MPEELWSTDIVYQSLYLYFDVKKTKKTLGLCQQLYRHRLKCQELNV